ncbi:MAG: tetratricopeptide repeat protein [Arcobacteraceae bacterium]
MKKIHFCVAQIIRIKKLIEIIESDFFARVISRKIIVRIDDFIDITRRYNNATVTDRVLKRTLKTKLNEINTEFENRLKLQRHKFSAHIQDLEFGLRIDSWANISYENILFFYDKIIETYDLLENQANYIPININDLEISQQEINKIQELVKEKDIENNPMVSTDILALTRFNSGAMIPGHPIQDKVLTLNSIVIILDFEIEIYKCFKHLDYKYLLQTLIINDIISFIDNIIPPGNSSEIGLNELLENRDILDRFLNTFNLEALEDIRNIRNKLGAHIDRDALFEELIELLENHNFEKTLSIYKNFLNIFYKICNETFYLKGLTLPPTKMQGVLEVSHKPEKTFFENVQIDTAFIKKDINDVELYKEYLNKLFIGISNDKYEDIRHYFYDALAHSEVFKTVTFDNKKLELKKAHEFFISKLKSSISPDKKRIILKLLSDCSNGYPEQLVYILTSTYNINKLTSLTKEYIVHLGDISHKHSNSAMLMLIGFLNSKDINIEYFTMLSLLKIDIKSRGIDCVNKKLKIVENEYSRVIKERINSYNPFFKVFISMLLSSEMVFNPMLGDYQKFFQELYFDYFEDIIFENINLLDVNITDDEMKILKEAKTGNYLSNIFLLLAEKFEDDKSELFYQAIANNLLRLNFAHLPFIEHLAYAKYKVGQLNEAVEIYKRLVDQNPDVVEYRIQLLNYYIEKKDSLAFDSELKYLENTFSLTDEQLKVLNQIKEISANE